MATTLKKGFIAALCAVMAIACAFVITGCGGNTVSKEEQATKALEDMLDQVQDGGLSEYMDEQTMDLSSLGIDYGDILDGISDNFSYEIKGAELGANDDVTVTVDITSRQIVPAIVDAFKQVYDETMQSALSGTMSTDYDTLQEQMMTRFGELIQEKINAENPTTTEVEVLMQQNGTQWEPDTESSTALSEAIIGDYNNIANELSAIYSGTN